YLADHLGGQVAQAAGHYVEVVLEDLERLVCTRAEHKNEDRSSERLVSEILLELLDLKLGLVDHTGLHSRRWIVWQNLHLEDLLLFLQFFKDFCETHLLSFFAPGTLLSPYRSGTQQPGWCPSSSLYRCGVRRRRARRASTASSSHHSWTARACMR